MENDYRITKLHGTFIGDNRIPDLPAGEKTKVFSSTNGKTAWVDLPDGGKSVSPCLNLIDFSGEQPTIRTSITEEEKNNLEKHLYNSVLYADLSTDGDQFSIYFPETAMSFEDTFIFSKYDMTVDETTGTSTIVGSSFYSISVGEEKNSDGTYPITIEKGMSASFGGGGGASVSPCLNLMNIDTGGVRTSITEEEKTNLEKGLYNSVLYTDPSTGAGSELSMYFPETAMSFLGEIGFSSYNISVDEASNAITISGSSLYSLSIGEKSADGTYPITIVKQFDATFGGGGGGGSSTPSTSIAFKDVTVSELANYVGKFGNFHITDCKIAFMIFGRESEITGVWFSGNVRNENYLGGSLWVYVSGSPGYYIFYGSGSYAINSNGKIEGGRCTVGVFNQYEFGSLQTFGNDGTFNSAAGSRSLAEVPDSGNFAYVGRINRVGGGSQQAIAFTSSVMLDATGDETYCKLSGIFTDGIGEMTFVKDTDGTPKSQKFTTWLPPVSANSDGKALIVTDGNAQWTTIPRYEHTVTIKNSEGKILWTQTMRNSSNTAVNSYTNLKTLFGEATYAGFGEYCQLDLRGGTEATDKLIKADGTEATLESLGAIVYTDVCFLPK